MRREEGEGISFNTNDDLYTVKSVAQCEYGTWLHRLFPSVSKFCTYMYRYMYLMYMYAFTNNLDKNVYVWLIRNSVPHFL